MQLPSIEGREIVPARLIPIITGFNLGPHSLTKLLAHKQGLSWPLSRPEDELFAYHLGPKGIPAQMLPKEWDVFVSDMEVLEKKFRSHEEFEDELYAEWRVEAVKLLPAGVFVWKEDLEAICYAWRNREALGEERPGSRELNFSPLIEGRYLPTIWEGFEHLRPSPQKNGNRGQGNRVNNSGGDENIARILLGYSDFISLCRVDDPEDWAPGFRIATDGVWVEPPQGSLLASSERAALNEHPDKDLSKPALTLPCTLGQLQTFLEWSGLYGCIDPFDMADFIQQEAENGKTSEKKSADTPPKKANPKEIDSLLKLVIAMATKGYGFDPSTKKSPIPGDIAAEVEQVGLSIDVDTVRKWLHRGAELLPPEWNEDD